MFYLVGVSCAGSLFKKSMVWVGESSLEIQVCPGCLYFRHLIQGIQTKKKPESHYQPALSLSSRLFSYYFIDTVHDFQLYLVEAIGRNATIPCCHRFQSLCINQEKKVFVFIFNTTHTHIYKLYNVYIYLHISIGSKNYQQEVEKLSLFDLTYSNKVHFPNYKNNYDSL